MTCSIRGMWRFLKKPQAIELWQTDIPEGDKEKLAHTLFCVENPPGTKCVSGSQDSIGIVFPGVNKLDYPSDSYWPEKITSITDDDTLKWIEEHLWFINLSPRDKCFDVLSGTKINEAGAKALANAALGLWLVGAACVRPSWIKTWRSSDTISKPPSKRRSRCFPTW